jgi:hypothetical protein
MNVYVLTATDRTGTADEITATFGVYSSREKATDAILYWMFEGGEKAEGYEDKDYIEEYVTDKNIWRIEEIEVDFVI